MLLTISKDGTATTKDVVFEETIAESENTSVFRVSIENKQYVLKVYHRYPEGAYYVEDRETDMFICESTAYHRLAQAGVCDRGIVPRYYGCSYDMDPSSLPPDLGAFMDDEVPPCAILLEYIPGLQDLDLTTFSENRKQRFHEAITEIHRLGILHEDIEPRHLAVQPSSDRIVVIDFDRAQTFPPNVLTEKWQQAFLEEEDLVKDLLESLAVDAQKGKLNKAILWYYHLSPRDRIRHFNGEDLSKEVEDLIRGRYYIGENR